MDYDKKRAAQRRLMREARMAERGTFLRLGGLAACSAIATLGFVYALASLLAGLSGMRPGLDLVQATSWLIATGLARTILAGLTEWTTVGFGIRRKYNYQRRLLAHWFGEPEIDEQSNGVGRELRIFEDGSAKIELFFQRYVPAAVQMAVIPPILLLGALWLDWPTALVLVVTGPLIPIFMILIGLAAVAQTRRQWAHLQSMGQMFLDFLRGGLLLRAMRKESWVRSVVEQTSERFRVTTMKVLAVAFLSALVLEILAMLGIAMVAAQAGVRLVEGWMDFRAALAVLLLAPEFYLPFRALGARHHAGMEGSESAASMFEILDQAQKREIQSQIAGQPGFTFRDVWFRYEPESDWVLRGVSFHLPTGKIGALHGTSGAGKSTLFSLALGFRRTERGDIFWNSRAAASITGAEWREQIAWVPQRPSFFPGTLRENLLLGRTGVNDETIDRILLQVGLQQKVRELRHGLDTAVAEAAHNFSTGERQRLAVARALLKEAPLLLFDEPTASLDHESEAMLVEILRSLAGTKTILLIAHRPQTLAVAQVIFEVNAGTVHTTERQS